MKVFSNEVEAADSLAADFKRLNEEISKTVIGQEEVVKNLLISIFCQGHSLLVGVPGLAKTLLIQTIASTLNLEFNRIQFTPDLMPSDILGSETLDKDRNLKFIKGPIFSNIILADEINRTPPKTQSALLESMQEYRVTIGGQSYPLDKPFFVLATQNPIEQEGTYPLPEAQLDRFMFMLNVDYPSFASEVEIVKNTTAGTRYQTQSILSKDEILAYQHLVRSIPVTDHVVEYAVGIVHKTRPNTEKAHAMTQKYLDWGAGPRASQTLILAAKCHAVLHGKYAPDIEDVRAIALPTLRHRILRNYKAEAEGVSTEQLVTEML